MQKGLILSVDDDQNLQLVLDQYLESDGYEVQTANSVQSALGVIDGSNFDVVLLDLGLPDGEGLSLIPQFKMQTNAAIIIVSGKSDTTEKIICLEMGADDYLTKPFEMRELSARIKAVMRRGVSVQDNQAPVMATEDVAHKEDEASVEPIMFNDGWCLNKAQYQLFNKEKESADLTTGEFQLLEALITAPNRALSREQLFERTRDGAYDVYDRAIDIQIARLRKKLDDDDQNIIKTVRGVGYMFCGTIDT